MATAKTQDKKTCFVITPIGDNNTDIRRHIDGIIDQVIEPAIGEKYKVVVAHREYEIGSINDRVIRSVYEADLVIANLTNTNPNAMYELAIRHSFGKPAIVIAEAGTKLPFDIIVENTIFYRNDPTGANELKQKLIEFERTINLRNQVYGPVYKVINRLPLHNEVESGRSVSNDKLLQYVIDRLDSLEENINIMMKNNSEEFCIDSSNRYLIMCFKKETPFEENEVKEIQRFFMMYSLRPYFEETENTLDVHFVNRDYNIISDLYDAIDRWIESKKNISYYVIVDR